MTTRPDRTEAVDYYFTYIDKVPDGDVNGILAAQDAELRAFAAGVSEERSLHRYGPGKWSMREVLSHINDTERAMVFRALWFARAFTDPLPSYDQDIAIASSAADSRSWSNHVEEFATIRAATLTLFRSLPADAWPRRGIASGYEFTVNALAFIVAGHAEHHLRILRERYV